MINDFLNYLETVRGMSPATCSGYEVNLREFFSYLSRKDNVNLNASTSFPEITLEMVDKIRIIDIHGFLSYCEKDRGNGASARARKVASIRAFFKYLHERLAVIDKNICSMLESPKIPKRDPVYLALDDAKKILYSMNGEDPMYYRDYAIITIFLNCGLRVSELCNLDYTNYKKNMLHVIGKGNKERQIPMNKACVEALADYIESRDDDCPALFISRLGKRMTNRSVEDLVAKHVKKAKLDPTLYTPHKLRHTCATLMYSSGADILQIQAVLGHENVSTTQIYTHLNDQQVRNAVNNNPMNN